MDRDLQAVLCRSAKDVAVQTSVCILSVSPYSSTSSELLWRWRPRCKCRWSFLTVEIRRHEEESHPQTLRHCNNFNKSIICLTDWFFHLQINSLFCLSLFRSVLSSFFFFFFLSSSSCFFCETQSSSTFPNPSQRSACNVRRVMCDWKLQCYLQLHRSKCEYSIFWTSTRVLIRKKERLEAESEVQSEAELSC